MDAYPPHYVVRTRPLLLLSGLGSGDDVPGPTSPPAHPPPPPADPAYLDAGPRITSGQPALTGATAVRLSSAVSARATAAGFAVRRAARELLLPPRKAPPPPAAAAGGVVSESGLARLHSPLSPLSASSPTFPDGVMTPLWLAKHQALVPAAAVHFYSFTTNRNLTTLRDNQLKTELASLNRQWQTSGYRTRIIIALVADSDSAAVFPPGDGGDDEDAILDRLTVLRRAAGLDPRAIFLLTPKLNPIDDAAATTAFANALVSAMRAAAADYYRDLSKHVRRKRNRASVPPPTVPPTAGTSSPLSGHGWQARYEFKLAVFAEFRGELGAASRSYEATHALLFDTEVIDAIAGWSPRFADLRLLADAVAIRLVRALLHASCPTAAVRAWSRHRDAVRDAVARRGRGTANYGWAAWESRWAVVMAQLIDSDAQGVRLPPLAPYAPPERNGDVWPAEHLHHPGYWLRAAAAHAVRRRDLAHAIPTEDRRRPASTAAPPKYTGLYDTYLAPAPYDEYPLETESQHDPETAHSARILGLLAPAHDRFVAAGQPRAVEALRLQLGRELAAAGRWQEALDLLRLLWEGANGNGDCSWRREGWWRLFEALTAAVHECAVRVGDADVILKVSWEMMNQGLSCALSFCG